MIDLPQRRQFASRDEFAAAVSATFAELHGEYEATPVAHLSPDWALDSGVYSVALPIDIAVNGGAAHGVASIVKHSIEMRKATIGRLARVERNGQWIVFFEAK